jgi:hypothetical protein
LQLQRPRMAVVCQKSADPKYSHRLRLTTFWIRPVAVATPSNCPPDHIRHTFDFELVTRAVISLFGIRKCANNMDLYSTVYIVPMGAPTRNF